MKISLKNRIVILDANIWIKGLFGFNKKAKSLIERCLNNEFKTAVSSYIIAEIVRVIKRICIKIGRDSIELERKLWIILNSKQIIKDFNVPITEDLIEFTKRKDEIKLIAKTFEIESKDVPYIVLAYKMNGCIVTEDNRSLYQRREIITKQLDIEIYSPDEIG